MTREQKFQDFFGAIRNKYNCLSFFILGSQRRWGLSHRGSAVAIGTSKFNPYTRLTASLR